ncbi:MAG: MBL fold metallo-hydrolase [Deltaproteobacteria bacterium]|nr:MBL fold metallo-hydrolase [Deltaproteobacteria bacterium]
MRRSRKVLLAIAAGVVAVGAGGFLCGACVLAAPTFRGAPSDHFDGEKFFDKKPEAQGALGLLRWQLTRDKGPWPEWIDVAPGPPPPPEVNEPGRLRVTVVNHATVLVQLDGVNILTDPIWSERASPFSFVGPKRVRAPGLRFEDLPKIDAVVLSHNHYDHMNVETLVRLRDAHEPLFIAGLGNDLFLGEQGITARAVDWGDVVDVLGVKIHSVPNQHFSNRGLGDNDGTLWSAYVFEGPTAGQAYFAGDTGYGSHFAEVGVKFPKLRVAMLPIGAYEPEWFMGSVHTTPGQAVRAQLDLRAAYAVAIHHATFPLADEGYEDAEQDLQVALDETERTSGARPAFDALPFGEGKDVP